MLQDIDFKFSPDFPADLGVCYSANPSFRKGTLRTGVCVCVLRVCVCALCERVYSLCARARARACVYVGAHLACWTTVTLVWASFLMFAYSCLRMIFASFVESCIHSSVCRIGYSFRLLLGLHLQSRGERSHKRQGAEPQRCQQHR